MGLRGKVNAPIKVIQYTGIETDTTVTETDNESPIKTIAVDLKKIKITGAYIGSTLNLQLLDSQNNPLSDVLQIEIDMSDAFYDALIGTKWGIEETDETEASEDEQ